MTGPGVPIETTLRSVRAAGRKILVTYVTGGMGPEWLPALEAMVAAGADLVEIGIPFSDPVMDGPTIQEASNRALSAGANPVSILDAVGRTHVAVPLVAMTYYNLISRAGHLRFSHMLTAGGVRGALVPDIPLEESVDWEREAGEAGVETVLLAAPITPDDRLVELCRRSRASSTGSTSWG